MIKQVLFFAGIFLLCAALEITSNSAPASSTGAPDEHDCTTSGCHDTYSTNSGNGTASVVIEGGITKYVPGNTYTLTVKVQQAGLLRFGFQLLALNAGKENCGTFQPISTLRNQVTKGYDALASRRYMTYTYESTLSNIIGENTWQFKWIAPSANEGNVTFYLAALAADNNGNDYGDYCYTRSLTVSPAEDVPRENYLTAFQSSDQSLNINYGIETAGTVKITMYNISGAKLQEAEMGMQSAGKHNMIIRADADYAAGFYLLQLNVNDKVLTKKIVLSR